jgi:DNA polymerase
MVRGHEIVPKYGKRVTDVLKGMLRPSIVPTEGKVFIVADWSAIEARANPWLAKDPMAEDLLNVFRDGGDIYIREAAGIFHKPQDDVTPDERQIGKVAILSLGYGGSVGAFNNMARAYGIAMSENQVKRIVEAWRRANLWAVHYWQELESAYTRAMRNPKREFTAGRVTYMYDKTHLWYALPSKRILCYPFAKFDGDELTYAKAAWKPSAEATEWPRARLWRGLAAENICQATSNDLLRHALRECDQAGIKIVLHCHDEIVAECERHEAEIFKSKIKEIMCTPPEWCDSLPLAVDIKIMERYGK